MVSLGKSDHWPFSKVAPWHLHWESSNFTIHVQSFNLKPLSGVLVTAQNKVENISTLWLWQSTVNSYLVSTLFMDWSGSQDKFPHSIQIIFIVTAWRNNVTSHLYFLAAGNNCSWIVMVAQGFLVVVMVWFSDVFWNTGVNNCSSNGL